MKDHSPEVSAEKATHHTPVWLVKLHTYYFTDCDYEVTFDGNTYQPFPLKLPEGFTLSRGNPLEGGQIQIGCLPEPPGAYPVMSSIVLNDLITNKPATVYRAYYDQYFNYIGHEVIFHGQVDGQPAIVGAWTIVELVPPGNPNVQPFGRRISRKDYPWMLAMGKKITMFGAIVEVE